MKPKLNLTFASKIILLASLFSVLVFSGFAQVWTIEVKGLVTENDKRLSGAVITVYDAGSVVNTVNASDGKFDLQLQADHDYILAFSKEGYITKRISFSTKNVPADRGKYGFTPFTIDQVDIFPEIEGTDIDQILQQPVGKILFSTKFHNGAGDFDFDERYTASIQAMLDKILAAKRLFEANYKKLITKGDAEFGNKLYNEAKPDYIAALKMKPNEQYPKDQLAAIEKALAAQKDEEAKNAQKAAAQKALQAQYDSLVKIGDAAFNAKDFDKARPAYTQASTILPNRRYPKDQIALMDKAIADKKKADQKNARPPADVQYDSIIKLADASFAAKDYINARNSYTSASQLKPVKQYPKQQIAAIDRFLAPHKAVLSQAKYDSIVKLADAAFHTKDYNTAKSDYTTASQMIPSKQYPKQQLAAIARLQAPRNPLQVQYDSIIKIADVSFQAKDYNTAKSNYNTAAQLITTKSYPRQQLAVIARLQAPKKKIPTLSDYDSVLKIADVAMHKKDYVTAKAGYTTASQMMPLKPYPQEQLIAIQGIIALHTKAPVLNKDSLAKLRKKDTIKVVHIPSSPCFTKALEDSCRPFMKPFTYGGVNSLHIPLKADAQEKEINLPAFSGQRYRMIFNMSSMPPGATVIIYTEDDTHKKRTALYTFGGGAEKIGKFDATTKTGKFCIDYEIPASNGTPGSGCSALMFGYENIR